MKSIDISWYTYSFYYKPKWIWNSLHQLHQLPNWGTTWKLVIPRVKQRVKWRCYRIFIKQEQQVLVKQWTWLQSLMDLIYLIWTNISIYDDDRKPGMLLGGCFYVVRNDVDQGMEWSTQIDIPDIDIPRNWSMSILQRIYH